MLLFFELITKDDLINSMTWQYLIMDVRSFNLQIKCFYRNFARDDIYQSIFEKIGKHNPKTYLRELMDGYSSY